MRRRRLCIAANLVADVRVGSIAPNAARVLQQRMSVAARKRQLATKVRCVVKGHFQTHALQQNAISLLSEIETSIDLAPSSAAVFVPLVDQPRKVETQCSRQSGFQHRVPT
jgi:hypothetical protein